MSVYVVDASLVLKWFVPEVQSAAARRWLAAGHDYVAPDLLFPETGNAVWKKVRRGELSPEDAQDLAHDLAAIGVEAVPTRTLVPDAQAIAVWTGLTVYDATYLTLAVRLDTQVITGDARFARTLMQHPQLAPHVRGLEDFVPE
jgi:predicted nucleic acid-binding protein